jgi:pyruvate dehydrogenase E2 component (dihydrolipoamide acetyltransferase)
MAVEIKLPELGENILKGDVVRVLVSIGDVIKKDQALVELETDKATIEVPSTSAGKVTAVRVKAGDKVKIGQLLVVLDEAAGASAPAPKTSAAAPAAEKAAPQPAAVAPAVASAARVPEEQATKVVDIMSARATPKTEPAPGAGPARTAAAALRSDASVAGVSSELAVPVPAAPSVRRFARELGVDISSVPGSGAAGRINQDDVQRFVKARMTTGAGPAAATPAATPLPDFAKWGAFDVRPMSGIRRKTAEHLTRAWQTIPHVTQHDKADITALEAFRKTHGSRVEKAGGKLTVTAILVKVVALAIDRYPQFASSVDMANESLIFKQYRHIGVAVDTPNGLLVPVIRDANRKTITEIAVEIGSLSQRARDKKLLLEEMAGGCFTISNLGGIGGTSFTPIVNAPEVAILGVSRGGIEPMWSDPQFVPREMLPLSLSYDHRVIDGADAIRFLRFIVEALEQPMAMLL